MILAILLGCHIKPTTATLLPWQLEFQTMRRPNRVARDRGPCSLWLSPRSSCPTWTCSSSTWRCPASGGISAALAGRAVLGAQRLRDRVRRPAGAGGTAGGPDRAAPGVPGRDHDLHAGVGGLRRRPGSRRPGRGPGRAGRGGGRADPDLAGAAAGGHPAGQAARPGPGLGRGRRRLGGPGPGGRRPAGPAGLAVGVPGQPADRGGRAAGRGPGAAAPAAPGQRATSRTSSAWCCSPPGSPG